MDNFPTGEFSYLRVERDAQDFKQAIEQMDLEITNAEEELARLEHDKTELELKLGESLKTDLDDDQEGNASEVIRQVLDSITYLKELKQQHPQLSGIDEEINSEQQVAEELARMNSKYEERTEKINLSMGKEIKLLGKFIRRMRLYIGDLHGFRGKLVHGQELLAELRTKRDQMLNSKN